MPELNDETEACLFWLTHGEHWAAVTRHNIGEARREAQEQLPEHRKMMTAILLADMLKARVKDAAEDAKDVITARGTKLDELMMELLDHSIEVRVEFCLLAPAVIERLGMAEARK